MAMTRRHNFGELELSVLKAIQELKQASVKEVQNHIGSRDQYTTIMTVMSRLADKGVLQREKEGRQYVYWMHPNKPSAPEGILSQIKKKIFGDKPVQMIAYLLDSEDHLSDEEIEELEQIIHKLKRRPQ